MLPRWVVRVSEIEGWVDPDMPARDSDTLGRQVAEAIGAQIPEASSLTWTTRAAP
jgi:hypothetical protein